ncbi:MAG: hypothetical protein AAGF73_08705 [Actinomycetota bacterium]
MTEPDVDLDAIAADLDDVERALQRLDDGTYWTDEVTGEPLDDELLARSPISRTAMRTEPNGLEPSGPAPSDAAPVDNASTAL